MGGTFPLKVLKDSQKLLRYSKRLQKKKAQILRMQSLYQLLLAIG